MIQQKTKMDFYDLDLSDNVLDALDDMRFKTCTPVQEKCIPRILEGKDLIGIAQTGTGKTAAYLLPILSLLDDGGYPQDACNCVIMSPTRELAQQIDQAMQGFSYYVDHVSSVAVYGGNDGTRFSQERTGLTMGADVIIATPGRLISHINMGYVDFSQTSFFVLDEADRMLDMGFYDDILKIAKLLPPRCQRIMFSATMPDKIKDLAVNLLNSPVEVRLAVSRPAEKVRQSAYICHEQQKLGILRHLFASDVLHRVIIFAGSKQKVKEIHQALLRQHVSCGAMHSDLSQSERDEMMHQFRSRQTDVLVATDIVARGIDIDDISMVINYDVPRDAEDYVHRVGRTARAQRDGAAVTLVGPRDIQRFRDIERFLKKKIQLSELPPALGPAPADTPPSASGGERRRQHRKRRPSGGRGRGPSNTNGRKRNRPSSPDNSKK